MLTLSIKDLMKWRKTIEMNNLYKAKKEGFPFGCLIFWVVPFGFILYKSLMTDGLKYFINVFYMIGGILLLTLLFIILSRIVCERHEQTLTGIIFLIIFILGFYIILFTDSTLTPEDLWHRPMKGR